MKSRRLAQIEDEDPGDARLTKHKESDDDKLKPAPRPDPPLQRQAVNMSNEPTGNAPQCVLSTYDQSLIGQMGSPVRSVGLAQTA